MLQRSLIILRYGVVSLCLPRLHSKSWAKIAMWQMLSKCEQCSTLVEWRDLKYLAGNIWCYQPNLFDHTHCLLLTIQVLSTVRLGISDFKKPSFIVCNRQCSMLLRNSFWTSLDMSGYLWTYQKIFKHIYISLNIF